MLHDDLERFSQLSGEKGVSLENVSRIGGYLDGYEKAVADFSQKCMDWNYHSKKKIPMIAIRSIRDDLMDYEAPRIEKLTDNQLAGISKNCGSISQHCDGCLIIGLEGCKTKFKNEIARRFREMVKDDGKNIPESNER